MAVSAINYLPPFANSLIMHVLTNAEKLIPLRDAASLAESRRLAGMRMVTGTTSPSTRYERISVSPASCSIKSEYVIASHAFKPQYKCINYIPAWEQRKLVDIAEIVGGGTPDTNNSNYWDGDIDWYAPAELGNNIYAESSTRKITQAGFDSCSTKMLPADKTILFTSRAGIGNTAILRHSACTNQGFQSLVIGDADVYFVYSMSERIKKWAEEKASGSTFLEISGRQLETMPVNLPSLVEQQAIGSFFSHLDDLITLHQRKRESRIIRVRSFIWLAGDISGIGVSAYQPEREDRMTEGNTNAETLFCDYYEQWISVYKEGAIREVTMKKYRLTQAWLGRLIPDLKLADMDRVNYQKLINGYAEHHERQTTMDFHHQLKGAILDAVDEGLIQRDPTRKAIIKGKPPCSKKTKYLNQFELHAVLADLELGKGPSWDWLILLVAKTGLRFSEALGLTPDDFDFVHQTLSVSKTWDYKNGGGFVPTKNASSVRKVQLDWQLIMQLSTLLKDMPASDPIFVNGKVYNSTANNILARHCERANVPVISIHGLRHTHASLLLFAGVSIASVSKRLGHASMNTTQDTYLHVIRELENKDVDIVMRALSTLI